MFAYCGNCPCAFKDADGLSYEFVGAGIQIDLSGSFGVAGGSVGLEVIVYWGTKEAEENGGLVVAVYGYGGISGDLVEGIREVSEITDLLLNNADLLKADGATALDALVNGLSFSAGISVSGVFVTADETFESAESYERWFDSYSYNGLFVKAAHAWSDCCKTYSIGGNLLSTSTKWGITRAKTFYKLLLCSTHQNKITR